MHLNRRTVLKLSTVGITAGLAGCSSNDGSVSTPGPDSSGTFELGEAAIFSNDESELSVTPLSASFHDTLLYTRGSQIYSDSPDSAAHTYLAIEMELVNNGSGSIELPDDPVLTLDGTQYEQTSTSAYSDSVYDAYRELQPGVSATSWLVYDVEYTEATASLIAEFGNGGTATWEFSTGSLDREVFAYSDLTIGEGVSLGIDDRQYRLTATSAEEREYADGNLLLVTFKAENTGAAPVEVPDLYDFILLSGSSQHDAMVWTGESEGYNGGEIAPGVVREGIIPFEVPETTSAYTLQTRLTEDIAASWSL